MVVHNSVMFRDSTSSSSASSLGCIAWRVVSGLEKIVSILIGFFFIFCSKLPKFEQTIWTVRCTLVTAYSCYIDLTRLTRYSFCFASSSHVKYDARFILKIKRTGFNGYTHSSQQHGQCLASPFFFHVIFTLGRQWIHVLI